MKRDEMYYARFDIAYNNFRSNRKEIVDKILKESSDPRTIESLFHSAFRSGVNFGEEESEIPKVVNEK